MNLVQSTSHAAILSYHNSGKADLHIERLYTARSCINSFMLIHVQGERKLRHHASYITITQRNMTPPYNTSYWYNSNYYLLFITFHYLILFADFIATRFQR